MKKKDIVLTLGLLAEKGACNQGIRKFKRWYPNGHATLTEVLRKLQELASTSADYDEYEIYIEYAKWLLLRFPSTQKPLVLNELTEKVIIHNGDLTIKKGVKGEYTIISNGNLNIKSSANLTGNTNIWVKKAKFQNIALDDSTGIAAKIIDATNIAVYGNAAIWAKKTIDATNIAAYGDARISAKKINTQNIIDDSYDGIHGEINLIRPSSNPQNVTQPANQLAFFITG